MRILTTIPVLAAALFLLTGCYTSDVSLTINANDTISGSIMFAVEEKYVPEADRENPFAAQMGELPEDAVVKTYNEDGHVGSVVEFKNIPREEFAHFVATQDDAPAWTIDRTETEYVFEGTVDLTVSEDEAAAFDTSEMMANAQVHYEVTFPGDVSEHNGTLTGDRTVEWNPAYGEAINMKASGEHSEKALNVSQNAALAGSAVAGALVLAIGVIVALKARQRPRGGKRRA